MWYNYLNSNIAVGRLMKLLKYPSSTWIWHSEVHLFDTEAYELIVKHCLATPNNQLKICQFQLLLFIREIQS